jgi:hypothetical protein
LLRLCLCHYTATEHLDEEYCGVECVAAQQV